MMTEEQKVQKDILDYLNGLDCCKAIKVVVSNEKGTPDIDCVWRGIPIKLEVKKSVEAIKQSKKDEPIQEIRLKEWHEAGAVTAFVCCVEQVEALLNSIGRRM